MDADGFTIVKRGGRQKTFKRTTVLASLEGPDVVVDFEKEKGKVMAALEELRKSELFADLSARLGKLKPCQELWCFGLGHVAACVSARYQLALLLLLRDVLKIPKERVFVNDPIFFCGEIELLKRLGLEVVSENIECNLKCQVSTLVFLPHCPKQLTNNLLFANWSPSGLAKLFLISNSFSNTVTRGIKSDIEKNANLIATLAEAEMMEEEELLNNFKFEDVFNDLALHQFKGLEEAQATFWEVKLPEYSEDAEFIRTASGR